MTKTPDSFVAEYTGKAIDYDGAYGVQCVDGFKVGCRYLGIPVMSTPNNWADGYWTGLNANGLPNKAILQWIATYFDKIRDYKQFKNGDWVVWGKNSPSHPSSHIAMFYNGMEFGERQGGDRSFCLTKTTFSDALGALRPKVWTTRIPDYESDTTINGHTYHLYGQGDLKAVVLSPGLNKTARIQELDTNAYVYAKITGCNLFQMKDDQPDPYGTTYGDISAPLCGVYQTLPNQDSTMFFDLETGEHADCTGITINELHNVFSPTLIYQPGKNVQYARVTGLSLCNYASRYAFVIRYPNGKYVLGLSDQDLTPNQIAQDFMNTTDLESISFIDGGGSAQMMRYITKEKRVEYTRDTGRATAGCIAFIGGTLPSEVTQDITEAPQPDEPAESEEEPMTETKPQEQPEMSPVEGWQDPEPAPQDHIILQRIASLMSVKSIITLALTAAFIALVVNAKDLPDDFVNIYTMCISFFFGYQFKKAEK